MSSSTTSPANETHTVSSPDRHRGMTHSQSGMTPTSGAELLKHCIEWVEKRRVSDRLRRIVLYCAVLYCVVLYCIVLYCIVLCCIILDCIALCCMVLCCIVLCCIVLCCMVLWFIVLCCIVSDCIAVIWCSWIRFLCFIFCKADLSCADDSCDLKFSKIFVILQFFQSWFSLSYIHVY